MRRTFGIGVTLLAIAATVLIGVGAYHAGYAQGVTHAAAAGGRVIRVIGRGYGPPFGFFPFGLLVFPLFVIGIILLLRGLAWRRWHGGPGWGHHHGYGGGPGGAGAAFEDWHRRQHEQPASAGPGHGQGQPTSV